ncbi:MAG: hypothetical protein MSH11_06165 [Ruminococcus sp.]|nr:hypothetical protein [Ruminococcus sp.]
MKLNLNDIVLFSNALKTTVNKLDNCLEILDKTENKITAAKDTEDACQYIHNIKTNLYKNIDLAKNLRRAIEHISREYTRTENLIIDMIDKAEYTKKMKIKFSSEIIYNGNLSLNVR